MRQHTYFPRLSYIFYLMFQYVNEWYLPPNVIERAPLYDITDIYPLAPLNELPYMTLLTSTP